MNKNTLMKTVLLSAIMATSSLSLAEEIGSVDTAFKVLGANHKIVIEVFDDEKVSGVSCYVSRAKTGGIKGSLGLAEDKAESSVSCVQVGPITIKQPLKRQEEVFSQRASILFKTIRVVRTVDTKRNTLIYMAYSEKLIDGSPQNSITAVPVGKPIAMK